jgi:REP element-mobilizing transposase RayT
MYVKTPNSNHMSRNYRFHDPEGIYFVTFTVVQWIDLFTRKRYADMVLDAIRWCQSNKGLKVYSWCIMSNHVHMIISAEGNWKPQDSLGSIKQFTAKQIVKDLKVQYGTGDHNWMLRLIKENGSKKSNVSEYSVWIHENHPKVIETHYNFKIKSNYIHNNPVKAGVVRRPEDYVYSSAIDYVGGEGMLEVVRW